MKHLSLIIPEGETKLSCIILAYEVILTANEYYAAQKKAPVFKVELVGEKKKNVLHEGLFSIQPEKHFKEVRKTDLVIIPSIEKDFNTILKKN